MKRSNDKVLICSQADIKGKKLILIFNLHHKRIGNKKRRERE